MSITLGVIGKQAVGLRVPQRLTRAEYKGYSGVLGLLSCITFMLSPPPFSLCAFLAKLVVAITFWVSIHDCKRNDNV